MKLTCDRVIQLIFAGHAIFTVFSSKTGKQFTYKFSRSKSGEPGYLVSVLSSHGRWLFVGTLNGQYWIGANQANPAFQAVRWFLNRMATRRPHPQLSVRFSERCCRCGRKLTDNESLRTGLGPECRKYV